jgi:hypothetical protein
VGLSGRDALAVRRRSKVNRIRNMLIAKKLTAVVNVPSA